MRQCHTFVQLSTDYLPKQMASFIRTLIIEQYQRDINGGNYVKMMTQMSFNNFELASEVTPLSYTSPSLTSQMNIARRKHDLIVKFTPLIIPPSRTPTK